MPHNELRNFRNFVYDVSNLRSQGYISNHTYSFMVTSAASLMINEKMTNQLNSYVHNKLESQFSNILKSRDV